MYHADGCYYQYSRLTRPSSDPSRVTRAVRHLTTGILAGRYTTSLAPLVLRYHVFMSNIPHRVPGNRDAYKLGRLAHSDAKSFDISTCKLWYAMVSLMRKDYAACLRTINDVLSQIPPYAQYMSDGLLLSSRESASLYEDIYLKSDAEVIKRLRTSWLLDLNFSMHMSYSIYLPAAVRVELSVCDEVVGVFVSPFVFAYYLMFLCHHELHQYDDRDRALRLLVDTVNNPEQRGALYYHSLNIAGYCLFLAEQRDRAHEMFLRSYQATEGSPYHKYNSAAQRIPW